MPVYATSDDLATWTGVSAPATATALLRQASLLVATATRTACYAVDSTGLPTAAAYVAALRDATCAQVEAWVALGIDPVKGAAGAVAVTASSIGGASLTYADSTAARTAAATTLCATSRQLLSAAGLLPAAVRSC